MEKSAISLVKKILKATKIGFAINAKLKAYLLQKSLEKLQHFYNKKIEKANFSYSPKNSLEAFKTSLTRHNSEFKSKPSGDLRVFWVGASHAQDNSGYLQSLRRLCKVTVYYDASGAYGINGQSGQSFDDVRASNDSTLLQKVKKAHSYGGIDILLGQMWAHLISPDTLLQIQKMGIPVINIAMDDRLPEHWSTHKNKAVGAIGLKSVTNMVLTTCSDVCSWYAIEGCPAIFFPLASDPTLFTNADSKTRDIDVLFIGNRYGIRSKIVEYLNKAGVSVECYGNGWKNGYVNAEKNIELSKRARIILGIGTVGYTENIYTLKLRDFDAVMTGSLYITHRNPDLCHLFKEDRDIVCYETAKEAADKIIFYLANEDAREAIGSSGRALAVESHSWDHRLDSVFKDLGIID